MGQLQEQETCMTGTFLFVNYRFYIKTTFAGNSWLC